jgi:hypothetical protein
MNVSERKDKLQRHRRKREPTPTRSDPSPTHWQNALTPASDSLQRRRPPANRFSSKGFAGQYKLAGAWPECNSARFADLATSRPALCKQTAHFAISLPKCHRDDTSVGRFRCIPDRHCSN